mgnify:FL=1
MRQLAKEYKQSAVLIDKRIKELTKIKKFLEARTKNPGSDPKIKELNCRLKDLNRMMKDLKEVTKEIEHYYDKGWWRSEKYTLNQRKARRFIYVEPIYDECSDEYEKEGGDDEVSDGFYRCSPD